MKATLLEYLQELQERKVEEESAAAETPAPTPPDETAYEEEKPHITIDTTTLDTEEPKKK